MLKTKKKMVPSRFLVEMYKMKMEVLIKLAKKNHKMDKGQN